MSIASSAACSTYAAKTAFTSFSTVTTSNLAISN
jgi:hypothetical protein